MYIVIGGYHFIFEIVNGDQLVCKVDLASFGQVLGDYIDLEIMSFDNGNPPMSFNETIRLTFKKHNTSFDFNLSNDVVLENSTAGTVIGQLKHNGRIDSRKTFEVDQIEKTFNITGNKLSLMRTINFDEQPSVSLTIKMTDVNSNQLSEKNFTIFVHPSKQCGNTTCGKNGRCMSANGSLVCDCHDGFKGDGRTCYPNDDCIHTDYLNNTIANPCKSDMKCIDMVNDFQCDCLEGLQGELCEVDARPDNPCLNFPCFNDGLCIANQSSLEKFTCICTVGWEGYLCTDNADDCEDNFCNGNGKCIDEHNSFYCECKEGFVGEFCQTVFESCTNTSCRHNETCIPYMPDTGVYNITCVHNQEIITLNVTANTTEEDSQDINSEFETFFMSHVNMVGEPLGLHRRPKRSTNQNQSEVVIFTIGSMSEDDYSLLSVIILNKYGQPYSRSQVLEAITTACSRINADVVVEDMFCPAVEKALNETIAESSPLPSVIPTLYDSSMSSVILESSIMPTLSDPSASFPLSDSISKTSLLSTPLSSLSYQAETLIVSNPFQSSNLFLDSTSMRTQIQPTSMLESTSSPGLSLDALMSTTVELFTSYPALSSSISPTKTFNLTSSTSVENGSFSPNLWNQSISWHKTPLMNITSFTPNTMPSSHVDALSSVSMTDSLAMSLSLMSSFEADMSSAFNGTAFGGDHSKQNLDPEKHNAQIGGVVAGVLMIVFIVAIIVTIVLCRRRHSGQWEPNQGDNYGNILNNATLRTKPHRDPPVGGELYGILELPTYTSGVYHKKSTSNLGLQSQDRSLKDPSPTTIPTKNANLKPRCVSESESEYKSNLSEFYESDKDELFGLENITANRSIPRGRHGEKPLSNLKLSQWRENKDRSIDVISASGLDLSPERAAFQNRQSLNKADDIIPSDFQNKEHENQANDNESRSDIYINQTSVREEDTNKCKECLFETYEENGMPVSLV
ncbi:unnamed protein product [Owenia fusiformis]|uniref:Uncharacterized protein n=1 Tax=Owenia fusiformis TaxID=6347 RepID=A0A8J1UJ99_OWEFU|nr:unnamed protein product [Owenia fusiformis]